MEEKENITHHYYKLGCHRRNFYFMYLYKQSNTKHG